MVLNTVYLYCCHLTGAKGLEQQCGSNIFIYSNIFILIYNYVERVIYIHAYRRF